MRDAELGSEKRFISARVKAAQGQVWPGLSGWRDSGQDNAEKGEREKAEGGRRHVRATGHVC